MKTTKIFSIIALIAAASMAFVSCEDDMSKNFKPAQVGDEIFFGGTAGYEDEARTQYGEKGTTGTPIMWYTGDQVRIYCAEARKVEGNSYCDYKVNQTSVTSSTLTSTAAYGLQWGSDADHKFYGVYPSPKMFATGSTEANTFQINGNTLTAYLPYTQNPQGSQAIQKDANGNYTVHPAMRFAYMTATAKANHKTLTADGVTMTFKPIVTAVEISLVNNSKNGNIGKALENISGVRIFAPEGELITGTFTADVTTGKITDVRNGKNYIDVNVYGEDGYPITLGYGKTLTFTVFMILDENENGYIEGLPSLGVSILSGGVYKSTVVTPTESASGVVNEGLIVNAKKKNFIKGISVTWNTELDLSAWMASIEDETPIDMLSIPGAGGVGSNSLKDENSKQQTLDIETLWNNGIRCFEMMVDRNGEGTIGDKKLICNGVETNITLNSAVQTIATKLAANTSECAFIIVGYQDLDYNSYSRNAGDNGWMKGFDTWFTGNDHMKKYATQPYNGNITLEDARGKIFCIARPVSMGLDSGWFTGFACDGSHKYSVVLGWGTHPDQWYARGFGELSYGDYKPTLNANLITENGAANRPYYVNETAPSTYTYYEIDSNATGVVPMSKGVKSFAYNYLNTSDTPYSPSCTTMAWVQEWKRVSNATTNYTSTGYYSRNRSETYNYQWCNSVAEKKSDIKGTLDIAQKGIYSLVINSLCGYYITNNAYSFKPRPVFQRYSNPNNPDKPYNYGFDDKYYSGVGKFTGSNLNSTGGAPNEVYRSYPGPFLWGGGLQGDIATFAADINKFFYDELMTIGVSNLSGPTGIVIMDRVKSSVSTDADKPGYYLPRFIVENSLRHYGKVGSDLGTGTQGK